MIKSLRVREKGFTLIELVIVIVIIGLIVAAIKTGSILIQQANIRTVIEEIARIRNSTQNFTFYYNALPGDISNAYSFFGSSACTNTTTSTTLVGNVACNGNGDGAIENQYGESVKAWYHLVESGMLGGVNFSGTWQVDNQEDATNSLQSKASSLAAYYFHDTYSPLDSTYTPKLYLMLGENHAGSKADRGAFSPEFAHILDVKIDDGLATKGSLTGSSGSNSLTCYISGTTTYLTSYNGSDACIIGLVLF